MNAPAATAGATTASKATTIALWVGQVGAAAIFAMAAFAKLFNFTDSGSKPLADALGVGRGAIASLGVIELAAVILLLVPKTRAIGALLGVGLMLGALGSHAAVIGFAGNPAAEMWPLALVALALSALVLVLRRGELPGFR